MDRTSTGSTGSAESTEYRPLFGATNLMDRPLFGVDSNRVKLINLIVGLTTTVLVVVTLIVAFAKTGSALYGLNIFLALCILVLCLGHMTLVFWYRQGDLEPKFSYLLYYQSLGLILISICALVFISKSSSCNC